MEAEKPKVKKLFIWLVLGILLFVAFEAFVASSGKKTHLEPGQPRLIEFYSDNCPACAMIKPILNELASKCDGKGVEIDFLNMKDTQTLKMALKLGVYQVPTLIFFDKNGKELERLVGFQPKDKIKQIINKMTDGQCEI